MSVRVKYSDELYHHGKKGMHWGERKYQNEDGSYTPLGRIHYGIGQARSAAASGVTKVKRAASAGAEKAKTGIKNAASTTGAYVKTNAPIVAKKVGTTAGNVAKKTGALALAGGAAAGAFAAANAPKVGRAIKRTAANYTPDEIRKRRTQKLRAKADYNYAVANSKRAKYDKKYAKKYVKENRKMAKWRYKEEKRKNTIEGKTKRAFLEAVDIAGKLSPLALMILTMKVGGGFDIINKATNPMANSIGSFTGKPELLLGTSEGKALMRQIVNSNKAAHNGVANMAELAGIARLLSGGTMGADGIFSNTADAGRILTEFGRLV